MPATRIQVVFDTADAAAMADFWAAATGYVEEEITTFIRGLVDAGVATDDDTVEIDGGGRRWRGVRSLRHPDDPVDERGVGTGRRLLFLDVPEGKTAKNRVHLDLLVGPDARAGEVERLRALGATILYEMDEPGSRHTTMADPEGNEFCVS